MISHNRRLRLGGLLTNVIAIFLLAGCSPKRGTEGRPWREFLGELTDIRRAARLDVLDTHLLTSADPMGSNDDYNHYVRKGPDGWWVLADLEGPGVLTRFWMTGPPRTHEIRLFLDDERKPAFSGSFETFFTDGDILAPPLSVHEQGCRYSFVPISFSKRLLLMVQEGSTDQGGWPRIFYQVNSSKSSVPVQSLPATLTPADRDALAAARQEWEDRTWRNPGPGDAVSQSLVAGPGQTAAMAPVAGPGTIALLQITPDLSGISSAAARERVLREVILRIRWDDAAQASVEVPLGDFFGSFGRRIRFDTMFVGMRDDTFECRWPMPFAKAAELSFENQGAEMVPLKVDLTVDRAAQPDGEWGYLHACWRRTVGRRDGRPHTVLSSPGRGKYVGCILNVFSEDRSWWMLEGDESIRVDGEATPSWQGTGLEDYFNGGWYYFNLLAQPLNGLVFKAPFRTLQYRFHLTDAVKFEKSVDMQFEMGPENRNPGFMESVAYFYLDKPGPSQSVLGRVADRYEPPDPLEAVTLMQQVLGAERLGDFQGAHDRIAEFLDMHPDAPQSDLLRLRMVAYREREEGIDAVRDVYSEYAQGPETAEATQQAKALLWIHEAQANALLGAYCNARTSIYLDGTLLGEVDHPARLAVIPLRLAPGRHVLSLEAQWARHDPWVLAFLRTHMGDVVTGIGWRWSRTPSGEWRKPGYDDSSWETVTFTTRDLPQVPYAEVVPNAFVGMQSIAQGMNEREWAPKKDLVVFRKEFVLE